METVMEHKIKTPLFKERITDLKAGDTALITGYIYTARDEAHRLLTDMAARGEALPFDLRNQVIYYSGPCPAKPGRVIGSCGPTTSGRMDKYAPKLISIGLSGMIGKGDRSDAVINAIKKYKSIYFAALGGAGALIARCVKSSETVAFPELGAEAVRRLFVEELPVFVAIDCGGNSIYRKSVGGEFFEHT